MPLSNLHEGEAINMHLGDHDQQDEFQPFLMSEDLGQREQLPRRLLGQLSRTWRKAQALITSEHGVSIFKCSLAYLLASLAVFIPFIGKLLGQQYGKHLVATITIYFHPARSQGSMYKALICASVAFLFATFLSLSSMWVTIVFHRKHDLIEIGHAVVLVVFVLGGFGFIGWIKQRLQDPLVNVACSLASLASILVITKEGAIQTGDLSFTKISQILRMLLLGIGISTAVSLTIMPVSARHKLRGDFSTLMDRELKTADFINLSSHHDKTFGHLKQLLGETKLEHYVAGTNREYSLEEELVHLMQDITHGLGGESDVVPPADTQDLDNESSSSTSQTRQQSPSIQSPAEIFRQLTSRLEMSILSLAVALKETFEEASFGPAPDRRLSVREEVISRINEAIDLYGESQRAAFHSLRRDWQMISPTQVDKASLEEILANCEYFSVGLLKLSEQLRSLLLVLEDLQLEVDKRPAGKSWSWLRFSWWPSRREQVIQDSDEAPLSGRSRAGDNRSSLQALNTSGQVQGPHRGRTHQQRGSKGPVRLFDFLRKDEIKFALKVGIGAALYALPSFISVTRPLYLSWRGEWGLISYMLVCSMTIGASNTAGFARFLGTCLGGLCSLAAWYLAGGDAFKLVLTGLVVGIGPFYLIIVKGQGPMGRFILLTYNLSVLYAFSQSQIDTDDEAEHLDITSIVLRRVVSVIAGNVWGIVITRGIWPIRARTKLDETLQSLWLRLAFIWESDPLNTISREEANMTVLYMNPHDKAEVEHLLSQLEPMQISARSEIELKEPFPDSAYGSVIRRTRDIVDIFHSMDLVLSGLGAPSEGQLLLLQHTTTARQRMSDCIANLLTTIAAAVEVGHTFSDFPTNVDRPRDELLAHISRYRQDKRVSGATNDEDYVLLYAYIIMSRQLSNEVIQITTELARIFPAPDGDLIGALRV
ncbi:hypothetical protein N7533_005695 [Penicillium manginii]|uniref:uncharacterized protein n=1 Tax=Penicillium manginii TaxID=203109 RepID=UPI0025472C87|nr:uncharacterized protein N7533_005695 [Penicillium manginii]KAJ5756152.1 hypothetical protein N7533_005695 [Penicillium manginii]